MSLLSTLIAMHGYKRPAGSATERLFITTYVATLPGAYQDTYRNWHVVVGDSPVIWSCHTDTVHHTSGRQTTHYEAKTGMLSLSRKAKQTSNCLGSDDTAGVFICAQMVLAGVPGHYIFHYGEECGGIGSGDLAAYERDMLGNYQFAIAFDRRGTHDIVTHQSWGRTASDVFARSLGEAIADVDPMLTYAAHRGIYTDTAEYQAVISECSNLSVGYYHEHSRQECLDTGHVLKLLAAMCALDQSALIADREPGSDDYQYVLSGYDEYDDPQFIETIGNTDYTHNYPGASRMAHLDPQFDTEGYRIPGNIQELSRDYYLDSAYADIQQALNRSALDPTDIATWKRSHTRKVS